MTLGLSGTFAKKAGLKGPSYDTAFSDVAGYNSALTQQTTPLPVIDLVSPVTGQMSEPGPAQNVNMKALQDAATLKPIVAPAPDTVMVKGTPQEVRENTNKQQGNITQAEIALNRITGADNKGSSPGADSGTGAGAKLAGAAAMTAFGFMAPGAAAVATAALAGAKALSQIAGGPGGLSGQGSLVTAQMQSNTYSLSAPAWKGNSREGYSSAFSSGSTAPSLSDQVNRVLSTGPGFGPGAIDNGRVALTCDSLNGMKIGGMNPDDYRDCLKDLKKNGKDVIDALNRRTHENVPLNESNAGRALAQGIKIDDIMTKPALDGRFV